MKKLLVTSLMFILVMFVLALSACSESPEETSLRIKQHQEELQQDRETAHMKATRQAIFVEEAVFQDNCKTGRMKWIDNRGWEQGVEAVVCDGLPTTSLQYRVGKHLEGVVHVGEAVDEVAAAKKVLEEDEKRTEAEAKAKALEKLSPEDKKALGL